MCKLSRKNVHPSQRGTYTLPPLGGVQPTVGSTDIHDPSEHSSHRAECPLSLCTHAQQVLNLCSVSPTSIASLECVGRPRLPLYVRVDAASCGVRHVGCLKS